jgi:hypothetical protein
MIHGCTRIGFDPFLDHIHVVSIDFLLHTAISDHMFINDNIRVGSELRAFEERKLRAFMDRGAGFGGRTTGDVQGNNQQGEEDWIHFFEVVDLYGDQYGFNFLFLIYNIRQCMKVAII